MDIGRWVLLSYRLPREPSTPRIALWRRLRGLGVAQLGDGLVALPADARAHEQFQWLAEEVEQAAGTASVWLAQPDSAKQERELISAMRAAISSEYRQLIAATRSAGEAPSRRRLAKLRRDLRKIKRRDYFPPAERERAEAAVQSLAARLEEMLA